MAVSRMVQARVPGEIQDAANAVIRASGLTVSDVVRVLMTRIAHDRALPLDLFQPNAETLAAFVAAGFPACRVVGAFLEDVCWRFHGHFPQCARRTGRGWC